MITEFKTPKSTTTSSSTSTCTTAGARAHAREESQDALDMICDCYIDALGRRPAAIIEDEIAEMMAKGVEPCVIMMALDETAAAPRPSWAYCRAILRACIREGATTAQGWRDRQDRWAGRRSGTHDFAERSYSNEDMDRLFTKLQ